MMTMETKTHWKKLTNPNYLGAYSLEPGLDLVVTIDRVVREEVTSVDGKKEECTVAYLKGQKPLILNRTNCKIITKLYNTPYIEEWRGKQIILYSANVKAFGDVVEALRIRPNIPNVKKQELTPSHPKWNGAVSALKAENTTIQDIEKVYIISEINRQKLIDETIQD